MNSRVWRKTFDFEELGIALLAMGAVKLELRCPQNENGIIAADPEPDWSFEALVSELNSLELKLNSSSIFPIPFTKTESRGLSNVKKGPTAFVMRVSDDEMEDVEREGGVEEVYDRSLVAGSRFACDELYLSDSDDESNLHDQFHLMDKAGVAEGAFFELTHEHQLAVKEEVRTQISVLETDLTHERKKSTSAIVRVEKYIEARREMDRKLDIQYQRNIAEALDNHMTAVQRDHEHRSQIEERRIRNEAAFEEARKEKALQEEKLRQEKAKAEAKVRLELAANKRAEEAKIAALEDERRAAKEAAEREGIGASTRAATEVAPKEATGHQRDASLGILNAQLNGSKTDGTKKEQSAGNILKSAESALKLEQERLQKYKEFDEKTQALGQSSNKDFQRHEQQFARRIRQISGAKENVRTKGNELIKMFNDPLCPQPINVAIFVKKVVSYFEVDQPSKVTYACGHVIVFVASQVPYAMDLLLAELHRVCIYTVPKHIDYSKSAFKSKEDYYKMIGYREENGKIERTEDYLKRLACYMKLYAALVQTEADGVQNPHGLKEGWAWLARFLNALPANVYTAVALEVFLQVAGFALFRKYRSQFRKILKVISGNFLVALKAQGEKVKEPKLKQVIGNIQYYVEKNEFLQEPEGWRMQGSLLSGSMVPELDYPDSYHHPSNYSGSYHYSSYY